MTIHADWLSLIEVSGAFLAEPVLDIAFPQGLEGFPTHKRQTFRQTYEEWRDAQDNDDELKDQLHIEWINWVLRVGLEWDEDGSEEDLKAQSDLPESLSLSMPEHGLVIKPDYALFGDDKSKPFVIVQTYTADTDLNKVLGSDGWSTSPAERMSHLCKATGVRLGLITNGEQWMLVDALEGSITSYATWYARLWSQEPSTLKSFYSLLNISAFFNGLGLDAKKLSELLDESLKHQDEVTETLGSQVQRAVEVLIQSLDRINKDKNGELLKGVEPSELYEAGLTYMMRLVFLLCAEERGLLLLGDETYESNYAVSTLRMKLREEAGQYGEEVLGFRNNAWSRLLAVFRAVYGGIEHEELRMPALGGSLFDPDRFPFLEGRLKGSNWRINEAHPLPIDNRTVLLFLDAIQLFQGRTLSYRALDVEQIGYVYEGLLEKTVIRADDVTLELNATQKSKTPWLKLGELASAELDGEEKVLALLQERTGSSASRVKNDYNKSLEPTKSAELLLACNNNTELRDRLLPYFHFLREDALGKPLIYAKNAFIVATGQDRRETGTHYTPKSLTEAVVKETLEPLVYEGPSIGSPREDWKLKTAAELLDLKVCDPAMGSGAFLVQVVRYLGERVCEAWEAAEATGKAVSIQGKVIESSAIEERMPPSSDTEARTLIARRLVAECCIYGVDVNPLAVELAKLSIWLVTLAKGRPFGFLDHNLRSGDSLLGLHKVSQLVGLSIRPSEKAQQRLFGREVDRLVTEAIDLRLRLRTVAIRDVRDVQAMAVLDSDVRQKLEVVELIADVFIGHVLVDGKKASDLEGFVNTLAIQADLAVSGDQGAINKLKQLAQDLLQRELPSGKSTRRPMHWCLEFPEVFTTRTGFDAIVGNPPFLGNRLWRGAMGELMQRQSELVLEEAAGKIDLCVVFHRQALRLLKQGGTYGLLATSNIAEGSSIKVGLGRILESGDIYSAQKGMEWPGAATVIVAKVHYYNGEWAGKRNLEGGEVDYIGPRLTFEAKDIWIPVVLNGCPFSFEGVNNSKGNAFLVTSQNEWFEALRSEKNNLLRPYISGDDITNASLTKIKRYALDIGDKSIETIKGEWPKAFEFLDRVVKPTRTAESLKSYKGLVDVWWRFARSRADLMKRLRQQPEFIAYSKNTKYPVGVLADSNWIYTNKVLLIAMERPDLFAISLSTGFRSWLEKYSGGHLGQTLSLSISESIAKYPLPEKIVELAAISAAKKFDQTVKEISIQRNCGLTAVINLVNNPEEIDDRIVLLRNLLAQIDTAVLATYGWSDVYSDYGFVHHDNLPTADQQRYMIPDDSKTEILIRLLCLNKERHMNGEPTSEKITSNKSDKPRPSTKNESETAQLGFGFSQNANKSTNQ